MLRDNGSASRSGRVVDVMTARCVVEDKAILFEKANDLAGLIAGSLGVITTRYTNRETYKASSNRSLN